VQGHRRVHGYSVADVDLIVQSAVYDHDGTLGLGHPVDVGVNIETGERAAKRNIGRKRGKRSEIQPRQDKQATNTSNHE